MIAILVVPTTFADLSTIDSALKMGSWLETAVEVSDDLSDYNVFNEQFTDFSGKDELKIIILSREAPEKEFTAKPEYPPFEGEGGFPDDFEGVDLGKPRIWVRCDLMKALPADFRAKSMAEATLLIMAENIYFMDGSISITDFRNNSGEEIPEFETIEEMIAYFSTHQREISSITYYPKFGTYASVTFYQTQTGKCMWIDGEMYNSRRFARNPEASDHWGNMTRLSQLMALAGEGEGIDDQSATEMIGGMDFVPEEKRNLWVSCVQTKEYSTLNHSVTEYYWTMAEQLKELDPSDTNRENYELIIAERNADVLPAYVSFCDYSGFEQSVDSIREAGEYIATYDREKLEASLTEVIGWFSSF